MGETRRLAAIMAVDVVAYSRLMGEDETGTARAVSEHREATRLLAVDKGGRIVKTMGDGLLLEFPSVVAAVECAVAMQNMMTERNADTPEAKRIVYRIGVNLGDVLIEGDDIIGEGVNIAARLEAICEPGGVMISSTAYDHVRGKLDAQFVDLGVRTLKNIARPVRTYAVKIGALALSSTAPERQGPPRLSLVVLPFANLGGGEEHEYFVDGVTESLTTDLSRIRGAFVIARNTAFAYKGKPADVTQIGRELNVRYVLEGSVQRSANRMRVNVQLIDAETSRHLWADRFDKPVADLFDMQDEILARLAGPLNVQFIAAEARRAEIASNPDAMDFCFQGLAWFNKGANQQNIDRAHEFFDRALAIDPDNFGALTGSAAADAFSGSQIMVADPATAFGKAEAKLARALSLAPDHAGGHSLLGLVYILTKRAAQGIAECEHALALDQNLAHARATIGLGMIYIDRPEETETHILEALRLSPRDPFAGGWMIHLGIAKSILGSIAESAEWFRRSIGANRNYAYPHFVWGAVLMRMGRLDEARASVKVGLELNPAFSVSRARAAFGAMSDNATYLTSLENGLEAMRIAGVPE